jgi:electron transport complex protein RnfC
VFEGKGGIDLAPTAAWPVPEASIPNAFVPPLAVISMRQIGTRQARCLVSPGDRVEECQIIGRAETPDAANVHSSIPGTVVAVRKIMAADGIDSEAVFVEFGGSFTRLGRRRELYPWKNMSVHDILHIIGERGVTGRTSEDGPLVRTLSPLKQGKALALIVDCSDAEPFQCSQRTCLLAKPREIAEALDILMKLVGPAPAILCARPGEAGPASALAKALDERAIPYRDIVLPAGYPSLSADALRSRARRFKGLEGIDGERGPVLSPASLLGLYDAIVLNKAAIEQVVTVSGDALKRPAILRARVGTRIGDLIGECGGFKGKISRLIVGGALTGRAISDPDAPVLKSTLSVIALGPAEIRNAHTAPCIRCGRCISACPASLDPGSLHKLIRAGRRMDAKAEGIASCTLCAACAYVCPSRLPLLREIGEALREGWGTR